MKKTNKITTTSQSKYPYLVTALGVGLMAVSEFYNLLRGMMFRVMYQPGAGYGSDYSGAHHFNGGFGFGLPSILTTVAVLLAIVGIFWLGLALRKSWKTANA